MLLTSLNLHLLVKVYLQIVTFQGAGGLEFQYMKSGKHNSVRNGQCEIEMFYQSEDDSN